MSRLVRIAPRSAALHVGVSMALIGVVAGAVYAGGGLIVDLATTGANPGTAMAFAALIGMPVYFGVIGVVAGGLGGAVYNLVSRRFGGIEMGWAD